MTAARIDPVWGDDFLAIAEAVGVVRNPDHDDEIWFLTTPGDLGDMLLGIELQTMALEFDLDRWDLDTPIPLVPTEAEKCGGCGETRADACGHRSWALCDECRLGICRDCRDETPGWDQ